MFINNNNIRTNTHLYWFGYYYYRFWRRTYCIFNDKMEGWREERGAGTFANGDGGGRKMCGAERSEAHESSATHGRGGRGRMSGYQTFPCSQKSVSESFLSRLFLRCSSDSVMISGVGIGAGIGIGVGVGIGIGIRDRDREGLLPQGLLLVCPLARLLVCWFARLNLPACSFDRLLVCSFDRLLVCSFDRLPV